MRNRRPRIVHIVIASGVACINAADAALYSVKMQKLYRGIRQARENLLPMATVQRFARSSDAHDAYRRGWAWAIETPLQSGNLTVPPALPIMGASQGCA